MKGLIFLRFRSNKGLLKVLFSFLKKSWAPCYYDYRSNVDKVAETHGMTDILKVIFGGN